MDAGCAPLTGDDRWTDPRWEYPEYPEGSVVEMRVHGIGGEPPSGMTRDPHPRLVGGDQLAGFWRARNPVVGRLDDVEGGPVHVREVLAWGGQTSGTIRHAFWVVLLPFALFNAAGRMHPSDPDGRRAQAHRAICRVLAYTMTLAITGLLGGVAFDLLGAQCGSTGCLTAARSGSALLAPVRYFKDEPAARMALLAFLPITGILALWWAGRYKTADLEGYQPPRAKIPPDGETCGLQQPLFWQNEWPTSRLRAAHATGAFALVAATLSLVLLDLAPPAEWWRWRSAAVVALLVTLACGVIVGLSATVRPRPSPTLLRWQVGLRFTAIAPLTIAIVVALAGSTNWRPTRWLAVLMCVCGAALCARWLYRELPKAKKERPDTKTRSNLLPAIGVALVAATLSGPIRVMQDRMLNTTGIPGGLGQLPDWVTQLAPGLYVPAYLLLLPLMVVQSALLLGLVVTCFERRIARRKGANQLDNAGIPGNLGGVVIAVLALLLLMAIGGSLHALTLDWLGTRHLAGQPTTTLYPLVLPWWYALAAFVMALVVPAAFLVVYLARWCAVRISATQLCAADVARDLERGLGAEPIDAEKKESARRLRAVGKAWGTQHLLRDAGTMLSWVVGTAMVSVAAYLAVVAATDRTLADVPLTTVAVWVMTSAAIAAVGLIRTALRAESTRREIGRLWDVLNFWPRVTHPFAPPCYGEVIVPMLRHRIGQLIDRGYRVVLAGHSQGSVVAMAAVAALEPRASLLERLALVTYGSPIAILYERFYRGVFGAKGRAIEDTQGKVASWHHVFAMTEPFAMPFWRVKPAGDRPARTGWSMNRMVVHPDTPCPACGWSRDPAGFGSASPSLAHADVVVSDPDRWTQPLDGRRPKHKGHSTYHDSRELDLHLRHIGTRLEAAHVPAAARADNEHHTLT